MEYMRIRDRLSFGTIKHRYSSIRLYETKLHDSIIDPFDSETDKIDYLMVERTQDYNTYGLAMDYIHYFEINHLM